MDYRISDVARTVAVSTGTVREWERQGLLHPRRTGSGFRIYDDADIDRARQIQRMRAVQGLNLAAVRLALDASDRGARKSGRRPHAGNARSGIGVTLRRLRLRRRLSLKQVSAAVGISTSALSLIERTSRGMTIAVVKRLADYFGVTVTSLADVKANRSTTVVRSGEGALVPLWGHGIEVRELAAGERLLDCQEWTLLPGAGSEGAYRHEGEEFIRVLEGSFEIVLDGTERNLLGKGDSIHFSSTRMHDWRNPGRRHTRLLWVNTPPTF